MSTPISFKDTDLVTKVGIAFASIGLEIDVKVITMVMGRVADLEKWKEIAQLMKDEAPGSEEVDMMVLTKVLDKFLSDGVEADELKIAKEDPGGSSCAVASSKRPTDLSKHIKVYDVFNDVPLSRWSAEAGFSEFKNFLRV